MIIKEQYDAPAARWETKTPPPVTDWTIMIKDAKGSVDGWFWAELCLPHRAPRRRRPSAVTVRASLYYQNIPPYYLRDRFTIGKGDATRRLYYIASNLNLNDTPMENWKILIATSQ